ncbi:methyltransferase domain-containing protein [Hyphomicrobium sp.]|uniref:methyltransferase domain-containing protein n=1 Tax=Hyphomicrobium sp. TaxID=82 RepID=UPI002FDD34C6
MYTDVATLRDFYATPLGRIARRLLARRVRAVWGPAAGETIASLGFGTPFLAAYRSEAHTLAALMPARQGVLIWPSSAPALSALVEEDELPLRDNSIDRLLVVHSLELTERTAPLLRELWRILKPEGRLLIIVPNRRGLWAHVDTTPFGRGCSYSRSQLDKLLHQCLFTPLAFGSALHLPPFDRGIVVRSALAWERLGMRVSPGLGGVLIVEARKEMMAPIKGTPARAKALQALAPTR